MQDTGSFGENCQVDISILVDMENIFQRQRLTARDHMAVEFILVTLILAGWKRPQGARALPLRACWTEHKNKNKKFDACKLSYV